MLERFGKFELQQRLGSGGMAEVFLAREVGPQGVLRIVVIKRILPTLVVDDEVASLFKDEARLGMLLVHPNIARIYEYGEIDGQHYISLEWLVGWSLRDIQKELSRQAIELPLEIAVGLVRDACRGLDFAHNVRSDEGEQLNTVHRDISPDNLFVTVEGALKVIDFGIAKSATQNHETIDGTVRCKPSYASPELLSGHDVDRRSDLFSVGVVLHEFLSAKRLFPQASLSSRLCDKELYSVAPPFRTRAIPEQLASLTVQTLQWRPGLRPQSAHILEQELSLALRDIETSVNRRYEPKATAQYLERLFNQDVPESYQTAPRVAHGFVEQGTLTAHKPLRDENGIDNAPTKTLRSPVEPAKKRQRSTRLALMVMAAFLGMFGLMITLTTPRRAKPADTQGDERASGSREPTAAPFSQAPPRAKEPTPPPEPKNKTTSQRHPKPGGRVSVRPKVRKRRVPKRKRRTKSSTHNAPGYGQVTLETIPWATVHHRGTNLGPTPLVKASLPVGRVRLVLRNQEFGIEKSVVLDVPKQGVLRKKLRLKP